MFIKRILTVFVAAPFVIGMIVCPVTAVFKSFVGLCLALALYEFFSMVGFSGRDRVFGMAVGLIHMAGLLFCPEVSEGSLAETSLLLVLIPAYFCLFHSESMEGIAARIGLMLLGILTVGTLGSFVGLARDLPDGAFWVFLILGMTWLNDTFAYFVGHRLGKHRLAPQISPGKTIEGFVGGFFGSLVGFLIFWWIYDTPISLGFGFALTLLVGLLGPLGDLSESMIKRSCHVKDSGDIIPGHGGMLDRIDALLFTAPVVYFFALFQ